MLCSISGTVPEEPVVSKTSGLVFERRLIEKVVQETGRCPVTDEPLASEDLLPISSSKAIRPRTTTATSIPGLLSLFQNEWDATVLETHQLRQALHASRQELSHALYQHDAACRVIARLLRERDSYRARLEAAQIAPAPTAAAAEANGKRPAPEANQTGAAGGGEDEGTAPAGKKPRAALGADVIEALTACSNELSKGRKKRQISPTLATSDDIAGYALQGSFPVHNTRKGGINAVAVAPASGAAGDQNVDNVVATAGTDGTVQIFDRIAQRNLASLAGHKKKVHDVSFIGSHRVLASGGADGTVRIWKAASSGGEEHQQDEDLSYECAAVLTDQQGEVVAVNPHPTRDYLLSASSDGAWCFYDLRRSECLARVGQESEEQQEGYASARLHPDGLILATGMSKSGGIKIWESRTQKCVATFDGHAGAVGSLSFSENGYYLASTANDGVKVWDLRKLKTVQHLTPYGEGQGAAAVTFDRSGVYLGVGGEDARVYGVKQEWKVVKECAEVAKKGVLSLAWAADARALVVGGGDHNLRVFAGPAEGQQ